MLLVQQGRIHCAGIGCIGHMQGECVAFQTGFFEMVPGLVRVVYSYGQLGFRGMEPIGGPNRVIVADSSVPVQNFIDGKFDRRA